MEIFKVTVRVRPALHHPEYYRIKFGYLLIWLFAKDHETAMTAGLNVARAMPLIIVGRKIEIFHGKPGSPNQAAKAEEARRYGLSWFLVGCAGSMPEGNFETELDDGSDNSEEDDADWWKKS